MKFKIAAGAEIDTITAGELADVMRRQASAWRAENAAGDRYVTFSAQGLIDGAAVEFGGSQARWQLGPTEGFVWDVRRININGHDITADTVTVYRNEATPLSVVGHTKQTQNNAGLFLLDRQCVLYDGDRLLVAGSSLAATGYVRITGTARELPISLAWRL